MLLSLLAAGVLAPKPPLFVLNHDALDPAQQVLAETLQGLVGRREPRIWLETKGVQEPILAELRRFGTPVQAAGDVWKLVDRFRAQVRGAVVYKLGAHSLNVANGLCGPMNAIAIDESMLGEAKAHRLPILLDVRGVSEEAAYAKYRPLYRKGCVVEQSIDKPGALRDYAVKHSAFVMDTDDGEFRKRVVRDMGPHALVFGWGRSEYGWISDISAAGGAGVPADWCVNLSALESLKAGPLRPPAVRPAPNEDHVRYVAFVLSDGDNVQWTTGGFATDPHFYGTPLHGRFPMTWEVSPLLARLAPLVLDYLYAHAAPTDGFVTGAGLPGYEYPFFQPDREALARQSEPFLRDSGLRIVSILNANEGALSDAFPWLDLPGVDGAIYKDYSPYNRRRGEIAWHHGKPVVSYRFVLWDGLMDVDQLAAAIARMPAEPRRDAGSYALVNVHAWSFAKSGGPIEAVRRVIDKLPPNTRVVTAPQLIGLLRRNRAGF